MRLSEIVFTMLLSSWFVTGCGTDRFEASNKAEGNNTTNAIGG